MKIYVNIKACRSGNGTECAPFKTISEAAKLAKAGDEVLVFPGVYREYVDPANAGTVDHPIVYRSVEPRKAVITGAEVISNWKKYKGDVWVSSIGNGIFNDYNPYTTKVFGDWYFADNAHTGEVYLNGRSMFEVYDLEDVINPKVDMKSWDKSFTVYTWYTEQRNGNTIIYANFHGIDPNVECVEINVRRNCFYPSKTGVGYITLSGFVVKQAATQWAPPTAYQEGMVGPHWSKGWVIENCEISDSKCVGISLGKYLQPNNENKWSLGRVKHGTQTERDAICQAQIEGWTKEKIGSHIIRGCDIHDCEQAGIVGHLGCAFSIIEDNHIHHINNKQQLKGAEIGGIKLHAAIDVIFRRNHIHHCTRGIWLDWQAQGTRVTQNLMHDNTPPLGTELPQELSLGEDIFVEVSHGPTLIDNNILLSIFSCKLATQGVAMVHNIISGPFIYVGSGTNNAGTNQPRYTPYHVAHRTEVAGFMTILHGDDRFYNNIFIQNPVAEEFLKVSKEKNWERIAVTGTAPFNDYPTREEFLQQFFVSGDSGAVEDRNKYYKHLPVSTGGNVFFNGAKPCTKEKNFRIVDNKVYVDLVEKDGKYHLYTNLNEVLPEFETEIISTETLGEAFEPEEKFENPDGSPIVFKYDYFDNGRTVNPLAGPFATKESYNEVLF
ncbi:right-handed parallel beta-helix repeat-containing protein [Succinatimonas hippei]|uniref:right-handed parallel beta-helix repeat-containing protein n=1 Tax=Succinatimonas hippei TaxID=626938 RepID=UPI00255C811F|nr:right-handed parallel beta-helix repeat-containing protein [Succinatimonas hippei]